jgi:hypothetical protein
VDVTKIHIGMGSFYAWSVTSKRLTPADITLRANAGTTIATYATSITRNDTGGKVYVLEGEVLLSTAQASITATTPRVLFGGLPDEATSIFPVSCPSTTVTSALPLKCSFTAVLTSLPSSIVGQARRVGALLMTQSDEVVVPEPQPEDVRPIANCVQLTDVISAGAATNGIKAKLEEAGAAVLSPYGVRVCKPTTLTYSVSLGPFDGSSVCGTFKVSGEVHNGGKPTGTEGLIKSAKANAISQSKCIYTSGKGRQLHWET